MPYMSQLLTRGFSKKVMKVVHARNALITASFDKEYVLLYEYQV